MDSPRWSDWTSFRDKVLKYLHTELAAIDSDIEQHEALPPEEKEACGLLVRSARLIEESSRHVKYSTPGNVTKLRSGDEVRIVDVATGRRNVAYVDVNDIDEMSFTFEADVVHPQVADVVVKELNTLKQVIALVSSYRPGSPGLGYLKVLAGIDPPRMNGLGGILNVLPDEIPECFNSVQRASVLMAIKRPSVGYIQGTPGSGKTHLLAVVARIYSNRGKDVVIMALTHQAVNNALNKIVELDADVPVAKVGREFKNIGLREEVVRVGSFREYLVQRRGTGGFVGRIGCVVGMTFQAALTNLGEVRSAFVPQVILFDEAGQLSLTHGSAVGAFGCGSVVFVGDDAQMPPIYHPLLEKSPLSISVFEDIKAIWAEAGQVLNVTYRMNEALTNYVSERYYRPKGVDLLSAHCSVGNRLREEEHPWLPKGISPIEFVECSCPGAMDENDVEAESVSSLVEELLRKGLSANRIAVITPFRRQVRLLQKTIKKRLGTSAALPLVDTVERLQGQDVDVLIASFATDSTQYFEQHQSFILNPNRVNVMFSRATSRVIVCGSRIVRLSLS